MTPDVPMPSDPEWDDDDVEVPVTALSGSSPGGASGAVDQLSDLLLELTLATLKATVLLSEADEDEWRVVAGRLGTFLNAAGQVPTKPRPSKRIGFKPRAKTKAKAKKARGKRAHRR